MLEQESTVECLTGALSEGSLSAGTKKSDQSVEKNTEIRRGGEKVHFPKDKLQQVKWKDLLRQWKLC